MSYQQHVSFSLLVLVMFLFFIFSAGPLDGVNQWTHIVDPALAKADDADGDYPRTEMLHNFDPYTLLSDPTE